MLTSDDWLFDLCPGYRDEQVIPFGLALHDPKAHDVEQQTSLNFFPLAVVLHLCKLLDSDC